MSRPDPPSNRRWLRGAAPHADAPRVICCPHSGGSATYFRSWQRSAPPDVAVLAVQYPGRHERLADPFAGSVREMADGLATEILRDSFAPVVLFGHSMGAAVAFETARRIRAAGVPLAALIVSSHTPPAVPVDSDLHTLPDEEMWRELAALGGTEPEILEMTDLREVYSPIVRADLTVSAEYVDPDCAGSLDVPVLALAGTRDAIAPADSMARWAEVTTAGWELRTYEGDHFHLQDHAEDILHTAYEMLSANDRVLAWRRG
jgi:pyochelin biosynthetic protein PchC